MPNTRTALPLIALMLASPAVAQQGSVRDFQLPPAPTPTPTQSQVQGPVDTESGPVPQAPRPVTTSAPAPTPTPQPTPTPAATDTPQQRSSPAPTRSEPAPRQTDAPTQRLPTRQPEVIQPIQAAPDEESPTPTTTSSPVPTIGQEIASAPSPEVEPPSDESDFPWWWLLGGAGLLAAGAGGLAFFRWRKASTPASAIEPPKVSAWPEAKPTVAEDGSASADTATASPPASLATTTARAGLTFSAKPKSFARSVMAVTFAFRLTVDNRSRAAMGPVTIRGDLTTAHGRVAPDEQLASADASLPELGRIETVEAGKSAEIDLEVRLLVREIRPIRQGSGVVYVPLMRLVVTDEAGNAVARTHLVGQVLDATQGRLQPFRLDEIPQSYPRLGMRPLD